MQIHVHLAEALAERPEGAGGSFLWQGEAGEALAGFLNEMLQASVAMAVVEIIQSL